MRLSKPHHRVTRTRVNVSKLLEFAELQWPLWIRRVFSTLSQGEGLRPAGSQYAYDELPGRSAPLHERVSGERGTEALALVLGYPCSGMVSVVVSIGSSKLRHLDGEIRADRLGCRGKSVI